MKTIEMVRLHRTPNTEVFIQEHFVNNSSDVSPRENMLLVAVDAAVKSANVAAASKLQTMESNHKVEIATLNANAARDSDLIAALRKQVESLEATLVAQRDAETERTKALAQSSVTVNTAGR